MAEPIRVITLKLCSSFCGFILTRAIDMNLGPPFFYNPLRKNDSDDLNHSSETVVFFIRFWHDISQLILWIYLCKGHKHELWFAIPVQYNPLIGMKKNNLIYQWMVSGGRTLLSKHVKHNTNTYFFKNWLTTLSPDTHIKTLGTNQTMKSPSGTRIKNSTSNHFLVWRWTLQIGSWILNCFLKGIGIN